jgi:CPA2 family monovalent cation:H+ antiporter-2
MSEGSFFQDLAVLMAVAGVAAAVFARLGWPKVLGYILSGVLLSRHTWGGAFLVDEHSVRIAGQLGIVFLMFSMGLGLSTAEMKKVGRVAVPVAVLDVAIMTGVGFTIGRSCLGWGFVPSLFLGVAVCDSATTLLAKVIDDMGWSSRPFVRRVLGASLFEDVICVGLVALATGVAGGGAMDFGAMGRSLGGLLVFFISTFFFGLVLVPKFLDYVSRRFDDETLLLTILGICFFVTYVAYRLGFSFALGAFMVGVLGASSEAKARISRVVAPLRSMYAAVFFVSVGLLVDPAECWRNMPAILLLSLAVMAGKFLNCTVGGIATGNGLKTSVQMGLSMAQIGEFAYMVALLYVAAADDSSCPIYQMVVGVSLLTTALNPLMIRLSDRAGSFAEDRCPKKVRRLIDAYRGLLEKYRSSSAGPRRRAVRSRLVELAVLGVLAFAIAFVFAALDARDWSHLSRFFDTHKRVFFCIAMNACLALVLVVVFRAARSLANSVASVIVGAGDDAWQVAMQRVVRVAVTAAAFGLSSLQVLFVNMNFAPAEPWAKATIAVVLVLAAAFGWRFFVRAGRGAAMNFAEALKTDERLARLSKEITITIPEGTLAEVPVPKGSPAVGATVGSLGVRAKTGASIVAAVRGGRRIRNIGPSFALMEGDVLVVIGDEEETAKLAELLRQPK